jgi:hypothetical protein
MMSDAAQIDRDLQSALAMLTSEQQRKNSFTTSEAVVILDQVGAPFARATLNKLRSVGGGPPFWKVNNCIRYPRNELLRWAIARRGPLMSSTSQYQRSPRC